MSTIMKSVPSSSDIVIIGGGVIGLSIAYFLSRRRALSILVIDEDRPGSAASASPSWPSPVAESVGLGGGAIFCKTLAKQPQPPLFFDFCLQSNAMFRELWQTLKADTGIDFKLERTGLKLVMYDDDDVSYGQAIQRSLPHLAQQLRWLDAKALRATEPRVNPAAVGALELLYDDQVSPFLLVHAYEAGARANGVTIVKETEVSDIELQGRSVVAVHAGGRRVRSGLVINAAGARAEEVARLVSVSLPLVPVRGQVALSQPLPKGFLNGCLSTRDCYVAQKDTGEVLVGNSTDHVDTPNHDDLRALVRGAVRAVPALRDVPIKQTWAGSRPCTPDELPILGPVDGLEGYLNACGHFHTGILTSAITGQLLHDWVFGEPLPIDIAPFLLQRFQISLPCNALMTA
jgi:hydrogen cyanide synthase HcnC